ALEHVWPADCHGVVRESFQDARRLPLTRRETMIFTSFEYVLFFAVVLLVRSCLRSFTLEKWFLLVASYVFYMSWSIPCGLLILGTSMTDYFVGVGLGRIENERKRKLLLVVSIVANLGVLAFFKYSNFFLTNASATLNILGF